MSLLNCKRIEMRKSTIGLVSQVSSQSFGLGGYWGGVLAMGGSCGNGAVCVCICVHVCVHACECLRASVSMSVCEWVWWKPPTVLTSSPAALDGSVETPHFLRGRRCRQKRLMMTVGGYWPLSDDTYFFHLFRDTFVKREPLRKYERVCHSVTQSEVPPWLSTSCLTSSKLRRGLDALKPLIL